MSNQKNKILKILFISLLTTHASLLASCGFRPVYGVNRDTSTGVEEKLALVDIENIPDRDGQFLRNALIDRFYRAGRPDAAQYGLSVNKITERLDDLDIAKTADTTRGQMRLSTHLTLTDRRTGQAVLDRDITSITSYNILGSEFASRVTEQNARDDALDDLARQIELQLSLFFKRQ